MLTLTNALAASIVMGLAFYTYHRHRKASALPFPPGPRKLPLIGNLLDMPPKFHWITYAQWGKDYSSLKKPYFLCLCLTSIYDKIAELSTLTSQD